jgi:hypothetical protein
VRLSKLSAFDQRLDRLVDEERIPSRPPMQPLGEVADARCVDAKGSLEQFARRLDRERPQAHALSVS